MQTLNIEETRNKKLLRIKDLMEIYGLSRSQVWRLRKSGDIPEPTIKSPAMWLEKAIDEHFEKRAMGM